MNGTTKILITVAMVGFSGAALAQGKPADKKAEPAKAAAPAVVAAAPGAPAMPMGPAKPDARLDDMKWIEGNWKCDGKMPAGAMGPDSKEMAYKSTMKVKRGLGGFWYVGEYEVKKTKDFPGMQASFTLGHDGKKYLSMGHDSMGGYGSSVATAWEGDKLVYTGEGMMMGMKTKSRDTVTKKGDKEMSYKSEADMGKGLNVMGEDNCKK